MYNSDSSSSSSPPHLQATVAHGQQQQQHQAPPSAMAVTTSTTIPVTPYLSQVCNYGPIFASSAYAHHHNYSPFHGYDRYKPDEINHNIDVDQMLPMATMLTTLSTIRWNYLFKC